jgi:hypothetical protein
VSPAGGGRSDSVFKSNWIRLAASVLAAAVALQGAGCGGPSNVGQVTGTVTLDGQPLESAFVEFEPLQGNSPSRGITDATGKYTLRYTREIEGAEIGEHRVRITTFSGGDPDAEPPKPTVREKLPAKYNAKTELTRKVESGMNTLDFPLESAGKVIQPKPDE